MKRYKFLVLVFIALLNGCTTKMMTMDSISSIQKGMTPIEVQNITGKKPSNQTLFEYKEDTYYADLYSMQIGTEQTTTASCTQYGCFPITIDVPIAKPYIFIYDDEQKLFTWGFPTEGKKTEHSYLYEMSYEILLEKTN